MAKPDEEREAPDRPEESDRPAHSDDEGATAGARDQDATSRKSELALPLGTVAQLAFVLVAAIGVYSFVSVAKEGELRRRCTPTCLLRPNYAGYERTAPSFTLKDTRGHDVSLESYRGKVVVLNFWTRTCAPCMEEMPEIAELARIVRPMKDVEVLTVSTDETTEEALDAIRSVLREEAPFPILMDPEATVVQSKFGTSLYPETWIIDKKGVVRARFDGAREWSSATVVKLLEQIRSGGYCPAEARGGRFVKDSAALCESLSSG